MNVTELIGLTNRLSTDKSELTPKERAAYLQYLNMANDELYEIASSGLKSILREEYVYFDDVQTRNAVPWGDNDIGAFKAPADLFKLDTVVAGRTSLKQGNHTIVKVAPSEEVTWKISSVGEAVEVCLTLRPVVPCPVGEMV
jgi:hypothetical protein